MMKNNLRPIVHDLKTGKEAYAQPGIKGKEYLYHKDAYNAELKTAGANINDYDFAELHNLVRGFIYPTGQITWDYSDKQQEALKDSYFVDRKLYPNVDFYSGIIYRGMGIPTDMFTVMFALGRLPGWIAQWKEMRLNKEPIGRPRQLYIGATKRSFVEINKR